MKDYVKKEYLVVWMISALIILLFSRFGFAKNLTKLGESLADFCEIQEPGNPIFQMFCAERQLEERDLFNYRYFEVYMQNIKIENGHKKFTPEQVVILKCFKKWDNHPSGWPNMRLVNYCCERNLQKLKDKEIKKETKPDGKKKPIGDH